MKSLAGECIRGVMVKHLDSGIVVSEFELQSCYYVHFWTNTLGKGMNPVILWVKQHHYCSSRRMDLALNNPTRLICHKTTKQISEKKGEKRETQKIPGQGQVMQTQREITNEHSTNKSMENVRGQINNQMQRK